MKTPKYLVLTGLFVVCLLSLRCAAISTFRTDPRLNWRTLKSEHFLVHYYDGLEADAQHVAKLAEEIYPAYEQEIRWKPWGRIHVVVADVKDTVDDLATVFPYPEVLILLARPDAGESLDTYNDWLRLVVTHELTHIFHLDKTGGFWGAMRYVFGRSILPNSVVPNWLSEGYAVFQESDKTGVGRVHNAYVDMVLRMDSLEDRFAPIDTLVVGSGRYPYGGQAYFYGGAFHQWIAQKYPKENFAEYARRYSSNPLNFFLLDYHASRIFNRSFIGLYDEFRADMKQKYEAQKRSVEARGLTKARQLTRDHAGKAGLLYSPDGKSLYFSASNSDTRSKFLRLDTESGREPEVVEYDLNADDYTWDSSRKSVFYSKPARWRDYYIYSGMGELDLETRKVHGVRFSGGVASPPHSGALDPVRETRRTFNPDMSVDGSLVYVVKQGSVQNVWIARPAANGESSWKRRGKNSAAAKMHVQQITQSPRGVEYYNPRWSPDGKTIVVSTKNESSKARNLVLLSAEGKELRRLTNDQSDNFRPLWSPDGKTIYFISDRTGIYNIYALSLSGGELAQVTNLLGGALEIAISPDGKRLAYLGYSSQGFDVYDMPIDPHTFFKIARAEPSEMIDPGNPDISKPLTASGEFQSTDYQPYSTVFVPRFIAPFFEIYNTDDFLVGALTGSADPIRHHAWQVFGYYQTKISEPGASVAYEYTGWYPKITIAGAVTPVTQSGTLFVRSPFTGGIYTVRGQFDNNLLIQRDIIGKILAGTKIPIRAVPGFDWVPGEHNISVGYEFIDHENVSDINPLSVRFRQPNPNPFLPQTTRRSAVFFPTEYQASGIVVHYSFDSTINRRRGISPTGEINKLKDWLGGYSIAAAYQFFNDALGGNWNQQIFTVDVRQYRRIPFTQHHVLALRGAGGFAFGNDPNPDTFQLGGSYPEGTLNVTTRNFYPLRGYSSRTFQGEKFFLLSGEYRFPIWLADRGLLTLPFYLKNISGAFFCDYGDARDTFYYQGHDGLVFNRGNMGVGGELRADATLFYTYPITGRLGLGFPVISNKNAHFKFSDNELILSLGTTF